MDRMAKHTRQPEVLRELFEALGNDPFIIAECLARPILSERLKLAKVEWRKGPLDSWRAGAENQMQKLTAAARTSYTLPQVSGLPYNLSPSDACTDNTWTPTSLTNAPDARYLHTAVWTGNEMIVWGGSNGNGLNTGGRYNPSTDSWTATSATSAPAGRYGHTAVWTGSEMIVWGGNDNTSYFNTGGRYKPSTDSRTATSATSTPAGRHGHTAGWTGSRMIVWGGYDGSNFRNAGGKYCAAALTPTPTPTPPQCTDDTWAPTSLSNAPDGRSFHRAVWTGSEMIVWGGNNNI